MSAAGRFRPLAALVLLGACSEYDVRKGEPEIAFSASTIDFGEVVLGNQSTIGILVENEGLGDLVVEQAELDGTTSADFEYLGIESTTIGPHESAELQVRYVPDVVGQDYGRVAITSNDPERPLAEVDLAAFGVEPRLDLDPETLWFGEVAAGESKTLEARLSARGTGTLRVKNLEFTEDAAGDAFAITPPEGVTLPYDMPVGYSVTIEVTFAPSDATEWDTELVISTNDPVTPTVALTLLGNTADDPTGNDPPEVELTDPDWGEYFVEGESVELAGVVYDQETAATDLACVFYSGTGLLGTAVPDADGNVSLGTTDLDAGEQSITLRCYDADGDMGEDSVTINVWDPEEPVLYTITGGDTLFDYWTVDDDVVITVDGVTIFSDTNHTQDNHPPLEFEASVGSEIHVTVTDQNYCQASLDPLTLFFGSSRSQALNEGQCASACAEDTCYDGSYEGPWPSIFYDQSFTIAIP